MTTVYDMNDVSLYRVRMDQKGSRLKTCHSAPTSRC